jgi:hypothetical protein
MAVKVEKKTEIAVTEQPDNERAVPVQDSIVLELALYENYMFQGKPFKKGKPYRFKTLEAMSLLRETDNGRPIWKQYRAPKPKVVLNPIPQDMTSLEIEEAFEHVPGTAEAQRRVEVGSDDELADIEGIFDTADDVVV